MRTWPFAADQPIETKPNYGLGAPALAGPDAKQHPTESSLRRLYIKTYSDLRELYRPEEVLTHRSAGFGTVFSFVCARPPHQPRARIPFPLRQDFVETVLPMIEKRIWRGAMANCAT